MVAVKGAVSLSDRREIEIEVSNAIIGRTEQIARFATTRAIKVRPTFLLEALPEVTPNIDLTRNSTATRLNSFGNLETVTSNTPRHSYSTTGEYLGVLQEELTTQFLLNNSNPVTQTISLPIGTYCLWLEGTGSAAITGAATGNAVAATPATFTLASAGSVTITFSGAVIRAQLENGGSFPTSFIPTTTSSAVRAADDWSMTLGSWFNPAEGVFFFEGSALSGVKASGMSRAIFTIETSSTNRILVFMSTDGSLAPRIASTAGGAFNPGSVSFTGDKFRVALRYGIGTGVGRMAVNGVLGTASSPTSLPTGLTTLKGKSTSIINTFNGRIERIGYLPRIVTDSEMVSLTSL